jgi:hypothetical protein
MLFFSCACVLSCVLAAPRAFAAYGCDCGTITALMNLQVVPSIVGQVNAVTMSEAELIKMDITLAARNIIGTIQTQTSAISQSVNTLKESNAAQAKGAAVGREIMSTIDLYGALSQPGGLCGSSTIGAGVQIGARNSQVIHQSMREKQIAHANAAGGKKPVDFLKRIAAGDHPDEKEMTEALFPLEHTLKADQVAKAHEAVKTLSNPQPLPLVTDAQKNTPAGQTYHAARKVHEARLAAATEAMNQHVAYHAPTLPEDVTAWAVEQWKSAGGSGEPPGVVEGKLSEAGLFKLLTQLRTGNPNWFGNIATLNNTGLLREIVIMQAISLDLARRQNEHLDRANFLNALEYTTKMGGTSSGKDMEALYEMSIGAQQ